MYCGPLQHLGFVHCPIREHCPAFPHCTDAIVERTVSKRVSRPASLLGDNNHLNIILLGESQCHVTVSLCHFDTVSL